MQFKQWWHNYWFLGSVWIELILLKLKTENWKHCSKIIFKCVNSTVGPIFNEKIDKKWNLWVSEQCTDTLFTENWSKVAAIVHLPYMNSSRKCWLFPVNSASVHCSWTHKFHFSVNFSLKMGLTALFTHLKIILLQCFQFSVFSFSKINPIQTDP